MRPEDPSGADHGRDRAAASPCPSCAKPAPADDRIACAICRREVCRACVRPYGHHMLVCEECRLAEW